MICEFVYLAEICMSNSCSIDLYFQRIQVFLPLFHSPTFLSNHVGTGSSSKYGSVRRESALVLLSMMALSARFSSMSFFDGTDIKDRCATFAYEAQLLFHETVVQPRLQPPSLVWLQGCVLLGYYIQSCRPVWGSELVITTCTRLAYSLKLHRVDDEESNTRDEATLSTSTDTFIAKEEKRRAWWSVWELDAFDSIVNRHPHTIDNSQVYVNLPISDQAWFQGTQAASNRLEPSISLCWKSLEDSPNKDERAWFLISNYILAQALALCQQRKSVESDIDDVETAAACFSNLFHATFRSSSSRLTFQQPDYAKSNWSVLTRLMVQKYVFSDRLLVSFYTKILCQRPHNNNLAQTAYPLRSHLHSSQPIRLRAQDRRTGRRPPTTLHLECRLISSARYRDLPYLSLLGARIHRLRSTPDGLHGRRSCCSYIAICVSSAPGERRGWRRRRTITIKHGRGSVDTHFVAFRTLLGHWHAVTR